MKTKFYLFFVLCSLILMTNSCKKDNDTPIPEEEVLEEDVTINNVKLSDKIVIIDSLLILISSNWELENGTYRYNYTNTLPNIQVGTIIVGISDEGYIRIVTSINITGNEITLQTEQATLEDLFEEGEIEISIDLDEGTGKTEEEIDYSVLEESWEDGVATSDNVDYSIGASISNSVNFNGSFYFNPRMNFRMKFVKDQGLTEFECELDNARADINAELSFNSTGTVNASIQKSLGHFTKQALFFIQGIPVVMTIKVELIAMGFVQLEGSGIIPVSFNNTNYLSYGIKYMNGSNDFITDYDGTSSLKSNPSIEIEAQARVDIVPQTTVTFYGVISTLIKPKPYTNFKAKEVEDSNGNKEVCAEVNLGVDLGLGIKGDVFGHNIFDLSKDWQIAEEKVWESEDDCEIGEIVISNPNYSGGGTDCSSDWLPYTLTVNYVDKDSILHKNGGTITIFWQFSSGESGSYDVAWSDVKVTENLLSWHQCTTWADASYLEESIYVTAESGDKSNIVTFIMTPGSGKTSNSSSGEASVRIE